MADAKPIEDYVRLPRAEVARLEDYLARTVRRLIDTPGVETQALAIEGEGVLLELAASRARDDTKLLLWGPNGRPTLPAAGKSKPPEIPAEAKT